MRHLVPTSRSGFTDARRDEAPLEPFVSSEERELFTLTLVSAKKRVRKGGDPLLYATPGPTRATPIELLVQSLARGGPHGGTTGVPRS